ncbi:MAG: right-handed parallel beta-helix repeat-containing protein [Gemmataceae bacterium]
MSKKWIEQLFSSRKISVNSRTQKPRRLNFVSLEDRVTPASPAVSFDNTLITIDEGAKATRTGTVVSAAGDVSISATPLGTVTPDLFNFTSATNFTWSYTPANGKSPAETTLITVTTTDEGGSTNNTFNLTVNNVAPTLTAGGSQYAITGKSMNVNLGNFTDPGAESHWTVEVDWNGDDSFDEIFNVSSAGDLSKAHAFATSGDHTVKVKVSDPDGGVSSVGSFTVTVSDDVLTTYVNDDFEELTNTSGGVSGTLEYGDTVSTGAGTAIYGYDAWPTIQEALDVTTATGTTNVLAGEYAEQVTISKAVSLIGPNAGKAGYDSRDPEAVITSNVADLSSGGVGIVTVLSSATDVTISGFTIDGDNDGISGGVDILSGESNAKRGVEVLGADRVTISNNVIQNLYGRGVQYEDKSGNAAVAGAVTQNSFNNIGLLDGSDGFGLLVFDSTPSFTDNQSVNINFGAQYQFLYTDSTPVNVTDNVLSTRLVGLVLNETGGSTGQITLENNEITTTEAGAIGINLWTVAHAGGTTLSNNTLSGSGGRGINAWTGTSDQTVAVSGGSISGYDTGVQIANEEFDGPYGVATGSNTITLTNLAITPADGGKAIYVWDTEDGNKDVTVGLSGVTINGDSAGTGTGIVLEGQYAKLDSDSLGDTTFAGFTGTSQYVTLQNLTYAAGGVIDGSDAKYEGTLGSDLTRTSTPSGFAVEDRITHYLDDEYVGYVNTTPNIAFVTQASGSIQRAIMYSEDGDTIYVDAGTYVENLSVYKPLDIRGPQDATDPRETNTEARPGGEAIIRPDSGTWSDLTLVHVTSDNVSIRGFTITGRNDDLSDAKPVMMINGVEVFAARGIANGTDGGGWKTINDLVVENNIFTDFGRFAVGMVNTSGVSSGGIINQNVIDNVEGYSPTGQGSPSSFGARQGVFLINDVYADITNNLMTRVERGIHVQFLNSATLPSINITGNDITSSTSGIYLSDPQATNQPIVSDNDLRTTHAYDTKYGDPAKYGENTAIAIMGGIGSSSPTITDNIIHEGAKFGYLLWAKPGTDVESTISISGGSVTDAFYGLMATNDNGGFTGGQYSSDDLLVEISGMEFSDNWYAIMAKDSPEDESAIGAVTIDVEDVTIGQGYVGIQAIGLNATANFKSGSVNENYFGIAVGDVEEFEALGGTVNVTAGEISANFIGIAFYLGNGSVSSVNFNGAVDNYYDIYIYEDEELLDSEVTIGSDISFAGDELYILNESALNFDISDSNATFDEVENFRIEDKMIHRVDDSSLGLITWVSKSIFVTNPSVLAPFEISEEIDESTDSSIQVGIDAAPTDATGWTVNVEGGTYNEDIVVSKQGLTVLGAGADSTTILGTMGDATIDTVQMPASAPNTTVAGFTITRDGNTLADWNGENGTLNNQGVAIYNSGGTLRDSVVVGNRNGVLVEAGANGVSIRNNLINNNRTGVHVVSLGNDGLTIEENEIADNWTMGILFRNNDGDAGTSSGQVEIHNNSITGNWYSGIERRAFQDDSIIIDASGNWFGTTTPLFVSNNAGGSGEPGYAGQIPEEFGGSSTAPLGPVPDILNSVGTQNLIDYSPYLWSGTDTDVGAYEDTMGFQGSFSVLGVTTEGAATEDNGRINEAIGYESGAATNINVAAGSYSEVVDLNRDNVTVTLLGDITVNSLKGEDGSTRIIDVDDSKFTYGDSDDYTFGGVFVGTETGSVVKQGSGKSTLTGDSSDLLGDFDVTAGEVVLSGAKLGGDVSILTAATLLGSGNVGGSLSNSGTLAPSDGTAAGTITIGNGYTQNENGTLEVRYTGSDGNTNPVAGTDYDTISVTGAVTLNSGSQLDFNASGNAPADFKGLVFIQNDDADAITGTFTGYDAGEVYDFGGGNLYFVTYAGQTGNDFLLLKVDTADALGHVYVDDSWASNSAGTVVSTLDGDAYIGFNAFSTIAGGLGKQETGGTIDISSGTYSESASLTTGTIRLRNSVGEVSNGVTISDLFNTDTGTTVNLNRIPLTLSGGTIDGVIIGVGSTSSLINNSGDLILSNSEIATVGRPF